MSNVTKSIDVNVPVRTAYDQWTQFESFPEFMEGVEEVRQLTDTNLHWRTNIGGHKAEYRRIKVRRCFFFIRFGFLPWRRALPLESMGTVGIPGHSGLFFSYLPGVIRTDQACAWTPPHQIPGLPPFRLVGIWPQRFHA